MWDDYEAFTVGLKRPGDNAGWKICLLPHFDAADRDFDDGLRVSNKPATDPDP